jgi:two-component system alkaline phosphatase synthesis response regulator PhoP
MTKERILIIEDEVDIANLMRYNLELHGYQVNMAHTGEEGLNLAKSLHPSLILLDLMLPGLDGEEVCRILRKTPESKETPIIMVTAKSSENDVVQGLDIGADDYLSKPFSPKILIARVGALLRRNRGEEVESNEKVLRIHDILIDPNRFEVEISNKKLDLTYTEFRLLQLLAKRPGWVFSRQQIVDSIRGDNCAVTERSVDVQVVGLRKKLRSHGKLVETVRGVGYRMKEE